jgi:hypothetical protein
MIGGLEPNDLSEAGWGLVFPAKSDPSRVLKSLEPLISWRREEAGEHAVRLFVHDDGYFENDTAAGWLRRHNVSLSVVDPTLGVPYYLLLVGKPNEIPFEFQYELDLYWGVGRVDFEELDDFRSYAESVVRSEKRNASVLEARDLVLFAPCHDFDRATQLFSQDVAIPLAFGSEGRPRLGERQGFGLRHLLGERATKAALTDVLRGGQSRPAAALVLAGSHGLSMTSDDYRQRVHQGALICQDWPGYGHIAQEHWFGASDVPDDADLIGTMYFLFACYGAGVPEFDNFSRDSGEPARLAPASFSARLPQALLAQKAGGALAVLGHVDRAWTSTFRTRGIGAQTQGMRDVIARLLKGDRIGYATDVFNMRWAALSVHLSEVLKDRAAGASLTEADFAAQWCARDDARNYIVLGDPATRLSKR